MRNLTTTSRWKKSLLFVLGLSVMLPPSLIQARLYNNAIETEVLSPIVGAKKINPTTVEILFPNSQRMTLDFYGENIFRVFQDNSGSVIRDPQAKPAAQILVDNPRKAVSKLDLEENTDFVFLTTGKIKVWLDKKTSLLKVTNLATNTVVVEELEAPLFEKGKVTLTLKENPQEYFYGGGVQNGRFSHKGNREPEQLDRRGSRLSYPLLLVYQRLRYDVVYLQKREVRLRSIRRGKGEIVSRIRLSGCVLHD